MRRFLIPAALAAIALAPAAQAATYRLGGLEVGQPWSRPAAKGGNGAGFMVLTNRGKAADTLTSVESPAARKVEIHRTSVANGIMKMQRQDAGLAIPPGQAVTFAPGGNHLMLLGLTEALKGGDKVPATLVFQSGARLKVEFQVGAAAPAADAHAHH
jgi:copper(I)-binding protein